MNRKIILAFTISFIFVQAGYSEGPPLAIKAEATLRSVVFPGWGQVYNGQERKGLYFLGANVLALSGRYISNIVYTTKLDEYSDSNNPSSLPDLWDQVERWRGIYDASRIAVIGVWSVSVFDAYLNANNSRWSANVQVNRVHDIDVPKITLSYSFD